MQRLGKLHPSNRNRKLRGQRTAGRRRLLVEPLEDRRLLASYTWVPGAGTLAISLGTGEDLTISEDGAVNRSFTIDSGTFSQAGGTAATGDGTVTLTFAGGDNIATSVTVNNTGAAAGTNNVTFGGGTITSATITVAATQAGTTSVIDFVAAATTLAGNVSLTSNGGDITDSTGSVVVTGTLSLNSGVDDIKLDDFASNDFRGAVTATGDDIDLEMTGSLLTGATSATTLYVNVFGDLTVGAGIVASSTVKLETDQTSMLAAGSITAGGDVTVYAYTGPIAMADGAVIDAGASNIYLDAVSDITIGLLQTTSASVSPPAVEIVTFPGSVLDADGAGGGDVDAPNGRLKVTSTGGIGTVGDPIEIVVSELEASNSGASQDISFWTSSGVTLVGVNNSGTGGNIYITAENVVTSPTITIAASSIVQTADGQITIQAIGPLASIVVNGTVLANGDDLELLADHDITGAAGAILQSAAGNVDIHANNDNSVNGGNSDGTIQIDASILVNSANTLTFWCSDYDGYLASSIEDAADVIKRGSGVLRLNGAANNYTGTTNIYGGALLINGALTRTSAGVSTGVVHVRSGGTLGGTGVIQNDDGPDAPGGVPTPGARDIIVYAGGTLDPGDINSTTGVHEPGQLTVWGDVDFQEDSTFAVQLDGLVPGTGHDQLVVLGTVDLTGTLTGANGANLAGEIRYPAPIGSRWEIIDNDDTETIDTRFQDVPEAGFTTFSGQVVNVSYLDDVQELVDNDVVVTLPGRFDFNGFGNHTATNYTGISPFQTKAGVAAGWVGALPWYFERFSALDPGWDSLRYDGQSTDPMGNPLTFAVDVVSDTAYEVMILTGSPVWNHDKQQFQVYDGSGAVPDPAPPLNAPLDSDTQVVDVWGAGAPDGSGVQVTWGGGTPNTAAGYYRWIRFTTEKITDIGASGQGSLLMKMLDRGGGNGTTVILAMDIRPVDSVGELTLTRADPAGAPPFSALPADGTTKDRYTGTGATPNAVLTVTVSANVTSGWPSQYAKVTPDTVPVPDVPPTPNAYNAIVATFGGQVKAAADGSFEFWVQRPAKLVSPTGDPPTENWTIMVEESTGLSRGSEVQPYLAPAETAALRFDFGTTTSPVQTYGIPAKPFLQVVPQTTYNVTRGYGWVGRVAGNDRRDNYLTYPYSGTHNTASDLRTDFNSGSNATFKVDVPNGTYSVRLYHSNPLYFGSVPYVTQPFTVTVQGTPYAVSAIAPGTTFIKELSAVPVVAGKLEILFGPGFLISGIDISAGSLPTESLLLAAGDPLDEGAAALGLDLLQPVVAEAAARWSAAGLTPAQTATLSNVQFTVTDLGGAVLGLANPVTNTIRIDDDAAMIGWSVVRGQSSVGSGPWTGNGQRTGAGVDLLTVVMHEMGHLLGYEHTDDADSLMAPVLSVTSRAAGRADAVEQLGQAAWQMGSSSFALRPSSFREDNLFTQLGRNDRTPDDSSAGAIAELPESADDGLLAAGIAKSDEETTQVRIPRRSRMQRFERDADTWFAELAAEEAVGG